MLEKDMIQQRGFRNVVEDGSMSGFQLRIRTPYYRGIWASLLEGANVTVDGEVFAKEDIRWTLAGTSFSLQELENSSGLRWQFDDAATLTVPKAGGLEPGLHEVKVELRFRASYMPENMQPWIERAQRKITLVA
jgi:hypothetical protein